MAEPGSRRLAGATLLAGVALAALPALLPGLLAQAGPFLAQPVLVLGWSLWRGSRQPRAPRMPLAADALAVAALWGLAFGLEALVVAWPLRALLDNGALIPALVLSLCVGFVLLGLWRLWPAFAQAARHGQGFGALLAAAARHGGREPVRGGIITVLVFVVLSAGSAWRSARRWISRCASRLSTG